ERRRYRPAFDLLENRLTPTPTTTTLTVAPVPGLANAPVTLTATVSGMALIQGAGTLSLSGATVAFFDGNTQLQAVPVSTGAVDATRVAPLAVALPQGSHQLTAKYAGESGTLSTFDSVNLITIMTPVNADPSTGTAATFSAGQPPTTTTLRATPNPAIVKKT